MPKRIEGVSARLLDCAKTEFLNKGFLGASIRDIASMAGTSARAVYTRFPDKQGLFSAIVEPAAQGFLEIFQNNMNTFWDEQAELTGKPGFTVDSSQDFYLRLVDFAYNHIDEFKLILTCSEGTPYADFPEQLTVLNCRQIENHSQKTGLKDHATTIELIHLLTRSFYTGMFEPIIHSMSREEAHFYVQKLCVFFVYGIQGLFK